MGRRTIHPPAPQPTGLRLLSRRHPHADVSGAVTADTNVITTSTRPTPRSATSSSTSSTATAPTGTSSTATAPSSTAASPSSTVTSPSSTAASPSRPQPQPMVLSLFGPGDFATVTGLRMQLRRAAAAAQGRELIVDLSDVPFMDAAGLDSLIEARALTLDRLTIRNPPMSLRRILEALGLTGQFTIVGSTPVDGDDR